MAALSSGQILLDRFTLVRSLGVGGQSRVWLAEDRELDERVVLKIVPADVPDDRLRLLRRECRHARKLVHPAIVPIYDIHRDGDFSFISMAWVDGADIGSLRRAEPTTIVRTLLPVVDALEHAHGQGVVHRDVKVANILLDAAGHARLLDFGIAGLLADDAEQVSGGGSRYNVSPQQLAGDAPQPGDDVYALGVLFYELISGRPPFWPSISDERIRSEPPRPVASATDSPDLPKLVPLIAAMLAKDPADRPATMARVAADLKAAVERPPAPTTTTTTSAIRPTDVRLTAPPRIEPVAPPLKWNAAEHAERDRRTRRLTWLTTVGVAVLIAALGAVVWVLPRWADARREARREAAATIATAPPPAAQVTDSAEDATAPPTPADTRPRRPVVSGVSADDALDAIVRGREWVTRLEARSVERWADALWGQAVEQLATAERHLTAERHAEALAAAEDALVLFDTVAANGLDALQQALEDGQRALKDGNAVAARDAFELAVTIAPDSEQARAGLARAAVLDDVLALLDSGEQNERRGNLEAAADNYRRAVEIDPLSQRARAALNRLDTRIAEHAFARTMSEGLTALDRGDFREAKQAFERALAERPEATEAIDGLAQSAEGLRVQSIAHHREQAAAAEADERWEVAVEHYDAVLALAPAIRFAQDGAARARKRADLAARIEYHLANPGRLQTIAVLDEARDALVEAERLAPGGERHQRHVAQLDALIASASTPIRVRLESDAETEVTIYKIGRLGTFTEHQVELRPGVYTVVGSRRGYRDVRLKVTVVAGQPPAPVVVRCEEAI